MGMADPVPTYSYFVTRLRDLHPDLAYIHVIESRLDGIENTTEDGPHVARSNDFIRKIWAPRPLVVAGGVISAEIAVEHAEKGEIVAIGRYFVSNVSSSELPKSSLLADRSLDAIQPDLVHRIKKGIPWAPYDRSTFYLPESPQGYIDYPFAEKVAPAVSSE